jgi:hypothetical protein
MQHFAQKRFIIRTTAAGDLFFRSKMHSCKTRFTCCENHFISILGQKKDKDQWIKKLLVVKKIKIRTTYAGHRSRHQLC